jgi:hypothetical protein
MLLLFFANFHCISGGWNKPQHQTVLAYWTDNTMGLIQLLDVFIDCGFYIATIKTNIVELCVIPALEKESNKYEVALWLTFERSDD